MPEPLIILRGLGPQLEGKSWESGSSLRIGRAEELEIHLPDSSISRVHAEIVCDEEGWLVRDMGSTNGTYVNGTRVNRTGHRLHPKDVIQFANLATLVASVQYGESGQRPLGNLKVEASAKHSLEKAMEVLGFNGGKAPGPDQPLLTLIRAGHHLCHIASLDEFLSRILDDAVAALDAQRGSIVLYDEADGALKLQAVTTQGGGVAGRSQYSTSLAQRTFEEGESFLCKDVANDPALLRTQSVAEGAMSSILSVLLRSPRKKLGVLHLDRSPFQAAFTKDDLFLADAVAASVSAGIESAQLLEKQQSLFLQTVTALAQAVDLRDQYTGGHTQRVAEYSLMIADEMKVTPEERNCIRVGTPLHDIGKIGIDDAILRKAGRLTPEETEIMKTHTVKGAAILETIPDLFEVIPIARNHHERWDGKGYPDGLAGEDIPKLARIIAVADAFDAMTTDRPYRMGLSLEEAFGELEKGSGKQFDPECAGAILRLRAEVQKKFDAWAAQRDFEAGLTEHKPKSGQQTVSVRRPRLS